MNIELYKPKHPGETTEDLSIGGFLKSIKPAVSVTLNNNAMQIIFSVKHVKTLPKTDEAFEGENIVRGRYYEVKRYTGSKRGTKRDYKEEYKRLKYTEKAQEKFEIQMDDFLIDIRESITGGSITKREAIDKCLIEKNYDHKLIMYTTLSYQSTVWERKKVLQNEKRL